MCIRDSFNPGKHLEENKEQLKSKAPLPEVSQSFLQKYMTKGALMCDQTVANDIDDLSDTDKVSLISDIELPDPLAFEPADTDVAVQGGDTGESLLKNISTIKK